ncbi:MULTISPECIES: hypothetical protein [unclassified Niallia]|jgi:hypothetical protein|uniref:hypothetical protein n=1 Tax=unclassified Niallia TaxID=2837522 RepID=UPI0030F773BD
MYVKVYEYHIPTDKIKEYFYIQEKASNIYRKYINSTTTYLQSNDDPTKWLEIRPIRLNKTIMPILL